MALARRTIQPPILTLEGLRSRANILFTIIAWIHVPAVALIALIARNEWQMPTAILAIAAVVATICLRTLREGLAMRAIMATILTLGPVMFVYAGRGHASGLSGNGDWQIDYHMYFFAIYAMLVAYVDWRPIALAATLTALHHLALDLIVPAGVFPEEGLDRVLLHAVTVIAECSVLFWIIHMLHQLFDKVRDLMEFTKESAANAIASEMAEKIALRQQLDHLQRSQE